MKKKFAVFGNPVQHSLSPFIHKNFAKQFNLNIVYEKIFIPINEFNFFIKNFFSNGGYGANITLPFKKQAYSISDKLTDRAKLVGVVNTLKYNNKNFLVGDNTDGIGLVEDLLRLKIFNKKNKKNILIIGTGGAAKGVVSFLLPYCKSITLTNKTLTNAIILKDYFKQSKKIFILPFNKKNSINFDLIIHATSGSALGEKLILPEKININQNTHCYDMFYILNKITPFLQWCKSKGSKNLYNGLGMLVGQAAHSFFFWNNMLPKVIPVINLLKKNKNIF